MECHISTTVLVGNGIEINNTSTSFNVPVSINTEEFHSDALLLDMGNAVDIILGTPWLANMGIIAWNFELMEMQFQRNGRTINLLGI
jgi:hypothetical protein